MARPRKPKPTTFASAPDEAPVKEVPQYVGIAEIFKTRKQLLLRAPTFKTRYYFRLLGVNGEKIAQSEGYTQKHNAKEVLDKYFPTFEVQDSTGE